MSVRATERLIGDLVKVTSQANSPLMVVKAIDEESKIITATWFTDSKLYQEGTFHATALDRAEVVKSSPKAGKPAAKRK